MADLKAFAEQLVNLLLLVLLLVQLLLKKKHLSMLF